MRLPMVEEINRLAVYNHFYIEGALTSMSNFNGPYHELEDIPNVEVIQAMKTLLAHEMICEYRDRICFYWDINGKGIEFLRILLRLH